jgi:endothelin-converting enzyme/putative endopeptidase
MVLTIQARYNADGNLIDWWTADDLAKFSVLGTTC